MNPALELENISCRWSNGAIAVDGVSLSIPPGEILSVIGPSGAGKTTLLRLVAGLAQPTSGNIFLSGRRVNGIPPSERDVSLQFQRAALYPGLTVRDNLAMGLRLECGFSLRERVLKRTSCEREIQQRVEEVAEELELTALLSRYGSQLSGGQQQRVALGRALARRKPLLLLDEPLSHLEIPLRRKIHLRLHLLQRHFPTTIVIVTHNPWDAFSLGDRVAVLLEGRLEQLAPPETIQDRPASLGVAKLLYGSELTLIRGECLEQDGERFFVVSGQRMGMPESQQRAIPSGKCLTVGFPRGAVKLANRSKVSDTLLEGMVRLVEPLQPHLCQVTVQSHQAPIALVVETDEAPLVQSKVGFTLDLERAFWFDGVTGRALSADIPA